MRAWSQKLVILSFLSFAACSNQSETQTVNLGVVNNDTEVDLALEAQKAATKNDYGLKLHPEVFNSAIDATLALCQGKIDAAIEALPDVKQQLDDPGLQGVMSSMNCGLSMLTHTFIYSVGIYSRRISSLSQLPQQSVVAVSVDPPLSPSRALLLLQSAGLIGLRPGVSANAKVDDIMSNPRQLIITPINPKELSSSVASAELMVISASDAVNSGTINTLLTESSPDYSMVILVRSKELQDDKFAGLVELYHSKAVISAAEKMTGNSAVPAWSNYMPPAQ